MMFSVKDGCFSYNKKENLLESINFCAKSGQIISILGPNGVGKTTLLRCMMGLLKWNSGSSLLDGENIHTIHRQKLWQTITYVPQAKGISFSYTIEEMVMFGRSSHIGFSKQPTPHDKEICFEAMKSVGIIHLREKFCNQISGGELQMALIARALCAQPQMLILDEPESNLDFRNQLIVLDTIQSLAKEKGICCIFNTHYPVHALKISDHSLILSKDGHADFGKTSELINEEKIRQVFHVNVDINEVTHDEINYKTVTAISIV